MFSHFPFCSHMDCSLPTWLFCPWDFPGKNTGMSFHFFFWGISLTQGLNPCLLHWQADSLPLSHLGISSERLRGHKCPLCGAREILYMHKSLLRSQKTGHQAIISLPFSPFPPPNSFVEIYLGSEGCEHIGMTLRQISHGGKAR